MQLEHHGERLLKFQSTMPEQNPDTGTITVLLNRIEDGDSAARDKLFELVYDQFKVLARSKLSGNAKRDVLQTTVVVNEACLRLNKNGFQVSPKNRGQLFAAANRAMQWVLADYARALKAKKRTPDESELVHATLERCELSAGVPFLDLHDALDELRTAHPRVASVVEGKFFGRLTNEELADLIELSVDTVKRDWRFGRAFLHAQLH